MEANIPVSLNRRTARLAVVVASFLALIKLVVGLLTNSISVIATAVDSVMDAAASAVNFFSIRKSEQPADHDHHYGHGKAESLAGLFQSIVIGLSGAYLIYKGCERAICGEVVQKVEAGIVVVGISILASFLLSRRLLKVSRQTESLALKADSVHYSADVYTNLGAIFALAIIKFTGYTIVDAVISIPIAGYIVWTATQVFRESVDVLMDKELEEDIESKVKSVVEKYHPEVAGFHDLRTRKSGSKKFIDFKLYVKKEVSFERSHEITEFVARDLRSKIVNSDVLIYADPF